MDADRHERAAYSRRPGPQTLRAVAARRLFDNLARLAHARVGDVGCGENGHGLPDPIAPAVPQEPRQGLGHLRPQRQAGQWCLATDRR